MTMLLHTQSLAAQRGELLLFRGLNLSLNAGEVVWLRGRNGKGKTSLLRILAGLSTPAEGSVSVSSEMIYIGHANALKDDLSASEALDFLVRVHGQAPSPASILAALTRMGVASHAQAMVRTLSQGQRRRVALARLAMSEPFESSEGSNPSGAARIWLLDEPFDALDDAGVNTLNGLLSEHVQRGGVALLTSHQALTLRDPQPRVVNLDKDAS
jgi:heme exporter protein A